MGYTMSGHQGQNRKKPCFYCLAEGPLSTNEYAELRTLGMNRKNCHDYHVDGAKLKKAMEYNNIVYQPLFIGPDEKLILDSFPPPTLHLKLRGLNHICDHLTKESKKIFKDDEGNGVDIVLEFCKENSIVRKDYFGGNYEGIALKYWVISKII